MSENTMIFVSVLFKNVIVGALVAGAIWYTESAWPLLGLVFMVCLRQGDDGSEV